jgi:hypothetical protein
MTDEVPKDQIMELAREIAGILDERSPDDVASGITLAIVLDALASQAKGWDHQTLACAVIDSMAGGCEMPLMKFVAQITERLVNKAARDGDPKAVEFAQRIRVAKSGPASTRHRVQFVSRRHRRPRS